MENTAVKMNLEALEKQLHGARSEGGTLNAVGRSYEPPPSCLYERRQQVSLLVRRRSSRASEAEKHHQF